MAEERVELSKKEHRTLILRGEIGDLLWQQNQLRAQMQFIQNEINKRMTELRGLVEPEGDKKGCTDCKKGEK